MEYDYAAYAPTYDLEYGTLTEDIPFYVELAKRTGGPVLEIAVGTGRVAIPVARAGIEVHGLDITAAMLDVARARLAAEPGLPITLHEADMRTADLREAGPFRLVYVPARAFLHMLTIEDQLAALANFRRHLAPGGTVAGNLFLPRYRLLARNSSGDLAWRYSHRYVDPRSGNPVHVSERAEVFPKTQRIEVLSRGEEVGPGGEIVRTFIRELRLAYLHRRELEHLLWRGGFELVELYGDFAGTPLDEGGEEMVFVARARE
jgi:SAM-dependent methyltransferase